MSGALKKRNNIGEIDDPRGMPMSTGRISLVFSPIVNDVDLSIRKLLVQTLGPFDYVF